jgi:hypothetical protein
VAPVYRYTRGKVDWMAAGLAVEGTETARARIVDHAHRDVPTCGLADPFDTVRTRLGAAGWDVAVVVGDGGVVLGLLAAGARAPEGAATATAAEVMIPAPATVRAHLSPAEVPESARKQEVFLVTTPDGALLGLVRPREVPALQPPPADERRRPGRPGLVIGPTTGGSDVQLEPRRGS